MKTRIYATPAVKGLKEGIKPYNADRPWARTTHHAPPHPPTHFTHTNFFLNLDKSKTLDVNIEKKLE